MQVALRHFWAAVHITSRRGGGLLAVSRRPKILPNVQLGEGLMKQGILAGLALAVLWASGGIALAQEKGGLDQTGPYEPVVGWFKPGFDRWDLPVASLAIDRPDRIIITNSDQSRTRPDAPMLTADGKVMKETSKASTLPKDQRTHTNMIMVLNGEGKMIESWTQWDKEITFAHNVQISPYDPERHIWITDLG